VLLDGGDNANTTFWGTAPLRIGKAKTLKNQCDLRQLSSLTANISRTNTDIEKAVKALSSKINRALNKKIW